MLKNADETKSYGQFYGSRASTCRPKLTVTYYDGPATASKVVTDPVYVGKGKDNIKVSWEGITSKSLNRIEYRIATMKNGEEAESN